ncbi:acylphosphatase [Luteimonas saliphila]|uniref:acylphosphatase n=1 Tax=Luteimonas saliphila TaxID=2804919 RepID=UPI00192E0071|nr:acylphosphatase [Luteimonas saliphila]
MPGVRFVVSGRVQGVCFRAGTRTQALGLGLRGYAKNLPDGSVEVVAVGEAQALEALAQWLEDGPALARVDAVGREDVDEDVQANGFAIL